MKEAAWPNVPRPPVSPSPCLLRPEPVDEGRVALRHPSVGLGARACRPAAAGRRDFDGSGRGVGGRAGCLVQARRRDPLGRALARQGGRQGRGRWREGDEDGGHGFVGRGRESRRRRRAEGGRREALRGSAGGVDLPRRRREDGGGRGERVGRGRLVQARQHLDLYRARAHRPHRARAHRARGGCGRRARRRSANVAGRRGARGSTPSSGRTARVTA